MSAKFPKQTLGHPNRKPPAQTQLSISVANVGPPCRLCGFVNHIRHRVRRSTAPFVDTCCNLVTSRQKLLMVARPNWIRTRRFGMVVVPATFGAKRRRGFLCTNHRIAGGRS